MLTLFYKKSERVGTNTLKVCRCRPEGGAVLESDEVLPGRRIGRVPTRPRGNSYWLLTAKPWESPICNRDQVVSCGLCWLRRALGGVIVVAEGFCRIGRFHRYVVQVRQNLRTALGLTMLAVDDSKRR